MCFTLKDCTSTIGKFNKILSSEIFSDLNKYNPVRTENSIGFKFPIKREFVFIKISPIKPNFKLIDNQHLKGLCEIVHPNIIRHFDIIAVSPNNKYFPNNVITVTEYIEPIDPLMVMLELHKDRKKLDLFIIQLLSGFKELHSKNILHKDINIYNITFKIKNNRISPVINDINIIQPYINSSLFCSPEFLAPEIDSFDQYNISAEIWGIGILLYFLLTFNFPFETRLNGSSVQDILKVIRNNEVYIMEESLSSPYNKIINLMLRRDARNRLTDLQLYIDMLKSESY